MEFSELYVGGCRLAVAEGPALLTDDGQGHALRVHSLVPCGGGAYVNLGLTEPLQADVCVLLRPPEAARVVRGLQGAVVGADAAGVWTLDETHLSLYDARGRTRLVQTWRAHQVFPRLDCEKQTYSFVARVHGEHCLVVPGNRAVVVPRDALWASHAHGRLHVIDAGHYACDGRRAPLPARCTRVVSAMHPWYVLDTAAGARVYVAGESGFADVPLPGRAPYIACAAGGEPTVFFHDAPFTQSLA